MSPGFHPVTHGATGSSPVPRPHAISTPSSSKPNAVPKASSSSATPARRGPPPQKAESRNQQLQQQQLRQNGCNPSESKLLTQIEQLSVAVKPNKAFVQPSTNGSSDAESVARSQPLAADIIDKLSPTMRSFVLKDKVAIVTGGARGLGLSMAKGLCESGIKAVAIFDIQPELGHSRAQTLQRVTDIPVKYYNVDVTDEKNVQSAVDQVIQHFGTIDILINSAGVAFSNLPAESHSYHLFKKTMDINLVGSFCVAQAVAKHMISAAKRLMAAASQPDSTKPLSLPDRSIIFVASMSGSIVNYPQPQSAYNASKAGVIQFSKCIAGEWAQYGIRVNTISPGYMDTILNQTPELNEQKKIWVSRTPMKRLGKVEELNNLAVWLAGEGSKFVTGSDFRADGGYSIY